MHWRTQFAGVAALVAVGLLHLTHVSAQDKDSLPDVPAALAALSATGEPIMLNLGDTKLPVGGHLQGIQAAYDAKANRQLVFISHDSLTVAYLAVADLPSSPAGEFSDRGVLRHVQQLPSDGQSPPLRHAGGMQLSGAILAVGVEDNQDKKRSQIQFWDTSDPSNLQQLKHLTILRTNESPKEATAGAVGLVEREKDFLLAIGNWDCRAVDFHVSNGKPLADPTCRFEHALTWRTESAATDDWRPDTIRGTYQALNLINDAAGDTFLLGFDTTTAGQDVIDLFAVDISRRSSRAIRKVARKTVTLGSECHFRYAGGAVVQNGKLLLLSSERNFRPRGETRLNLLQ